MPVILHVLARILEIKNTSTITVLQVIVWVCFLLDHRWFPFTSKHHHSEYHVCADFTVHILKFLLLDFKNWNQQPLRWEVKAFQNTKKSEKILGAVLLCHVCKKRWKYCRTFVTQQTSPVLLTGALPWLAAGPVNTAGIRQALVTERTLPAVVTPATHSEEDC